MSSTTATSSSPHSPAAGPDEWADLVHDGACFIAGSWVHGHGPASPTFNPSNGLVLAAPAASDERQVEEAARAARHAFDKGEWSRLGPAERSALLFRLADLLERDRDRLVRLVASEVGTPISSAAQIQVDGPIAYFRWFAEAAARGPEWGGYERSLPLHHDPITSSSILVRHPAGVVAALTSYNFPIQLCAWKLGPALASGCSVVLAPSPKAILSTVAFVRLAEEAGFPPGAVNLVFGGPTVAEAVCTAPEVDMITFTGSPQVGSRIMQLAAPDLKKVVLELGGKSPNIVLPGADVGLTIASSCQRFTMNNGQACGATTRAFVPTSVFDEYVERSVAYLDSMVVGDALDPATGVGPLITQEHLVGVEGYLERAVQGGGTIVTGGRRPQALDDGYFLQPTLVTGLGNDAEIAQEELFAPVVTVMPYESVDEVVRLANASRFALNANIWGPTAEALGVARRLRSGTVTVNGGGGRRQDAPWGGPGHSGVGRDCGEEGFLEFFETQHVQWPL
ncbi:aldehyde dehydrogenase family protein [Aeromicrobium sp. 636]|uniref:Aldehyde dehydrogenase family protein n=1 Tax=Aeromicrobium senzhongii TaxID=2663859 RepID=A0A8I0EW72_9ACTN|nr:MULTISPECIES: aldehyde dehydrogenase family protein [Aeromicrobium]MBC9226468.1 aldehyde dehydrogenase family protein [Aeromicrobium senzhongii]MCQ3998572.1 aldehyde dehydrogenase family protein [Aeromicrobium sp. 636]